MYTLTDRQYETMWRHLRMLSHESNARRLLQGQLSRNRRFCPYPTSDLDTKACQVSYCIVQAFEYYRAADAVTIDTSPLLYYYGMLALSKALIVANSAATHLDDIRYHGLKACRALSSPNLEGQTVSIGDGVFRQLTKVIQGFQYPARSEFVLRDLLSISPELSEIYERFFELPSRCLPRHFMRFLAEEPCRLELCVIAPDDEFVSRRIPELRRDFDLRQSAESGRVANYQWFTSKPIAARPPVGFWWYNSVIGGEYLVGALPFHSDGSAGRRYLHPPLSDFITMFILSDCVRYKQDLWRKAVQGRDTGVLGLIDLFVDLSRRRFPNFVLDQLFKEPFEYAPKERALQPYVGTTQWPPP